MAIYAMWRIEAVLVKSIARSTMHCETVNARRFVIATMLGSNCKEISQLLLPKSSIS